MKCQVVRKLFFSDYLLTFLELLTLLCHVHLSWGSADQHLLRDVSASCVPVDKRP